MPPSASGWLHQGAMPQKDLWGNTVTSPLSPRPWAEKKAAEKEQKEAAKAEKKKAQEPPRNELNCTLSKGELLANFLSM